MSAIVWNSNLSSGSHQARCKDCGWDGTKHVGAGAYNHNQATAEAETHNNEHHQEPETLPAGITSLEPIPYGERRWNGAVWAPVQVERYNAELTRIAERHRAGIGVQHLVDGLYNLASGFDYAGKP